MKPRVSLVLGSGGARGYAHIGVIEELEARGYEIVSISGCSMGALIGGIHAAGQLEGYRDWVCQLDYFDVLRLVDITWSAMGAMRAGKVMTKLKSLVGDIQIEALPLPFTAVATDLTRQREVWFQSGSLLRAIRASIAVPGIITPVQEHGQVLVDGGLLNPLPIIPTVSVAADIVLAVNATAQTPRPISLEALLPAERAAEEEQREREREAAGKSFSGWLGGVRNRVQGMISSFSDEEESAGDTWSSQTERAWSKLDMMLASFDITQAALAKYKIAGYPPDVLIEVPKSVCGAYEFHRAEALIELGRYLAAQALDRHEAQRDQTRASGEPVNARRHPLSSGGSRTEMPLPLSSPKRQE
ncbi:patatin-like phospholipase family protein [Salinicola sp. DM10]|uniref:patatin-like phospholipase family protein n=1 Tax=Salinicola sp. DM10 TaxID=2815721 RepID=UPI001A902BDF|nr:patatin-like phospholipase family protein [Salinicola sp. DM10]MCE3026117.1 patatin-like phospholipase family protein [Salinicola sp. DM10]